MSLSSVHGGNTDCSLLHGGQVLGCVGAGACSNDAEVARIMQFVLRALGNASADRLKLLADAFAQTPPPQRAAFGQVGPWAIELFVHEGLLFPIRQS